VTGQNIANVNTEGYRKRSADLNEVSGTQSELTSITSQIGLGVALGEVRRAYNVFLASSTNSSESRFQSSQTFVESMERLENAILPGEGDLSSQITKFFRTLSDVEASPGDLAPRAAAIEQGNGLANAFNVTAFVLRDLEVQISGTIDQEVSEVNRLVSSLGSVNGKLRSSNLGSSPPNALMDERDRLITEIAKKVRISVNYGARHDVNVRLGENLTGPVLLDGETATNIKPIYGESNGVSFLLGSSSVIKSLDDGGVKGLSTALSVIQDTHSQLNILANRFVNEVNQIHRNGIDYDGTFGRSMFTAKEFTVEAHSGDVEALQVNLLSVPGLVDDVVEAVFKYDAKTDFWTAYDQNNQALGSGRSRIDLGGLIVNIGEKAVDGDSFVIRSAGGEADRLSFLLTDGRQIAAASNFVITSNSNNSGAARLESKAVENVTPDLASITDVTNNTLSSVGYTEFLNGGAIAYIPADVKNIDLASFGQNQTITFNFNKLDALRDFAFVLEGQEYKASIDKELAESFRDTFQLAEYLNNNFVSLTQTGASDSSTSFNELGLYASGFEGGLKLTGSKTFTSGTVSTLRSTSGESVSESDVVTQTAIISPAEDASSFRVFSREGRQIAGIPLSSSEAHILLTEANGFNANAEYRADYLNPIDGLGYRGATIKNLLPNGYSTIESAANLLTGGLVNSTDALIQQGNLLSPIEGQTLTFKTTGIDSTGMSNAAPDGLVEVDIAIDSGVNMKTIAEDINLKLEAFGFIAEAKTHASLRLGSDASPSGEISFELSSGESESIPITGIFGNSDLSPLVGKINQNTIRTGVSAEVSSDGSRIVLIQAEGKDIIIKNIEGEPLLINSLDQNFNNLVDSDVALGEDTKVIGSLSLRSARAFEVVSSLSDQTTALSQTFSKEEGGVREAFSKAGTVSDFAFDIDPAILQSQASHDGLRLVASDTTFSMTAKMNGSITNFEPVNTNTLNELSIESLSNALIHDLRSTTALPALVGAEFSTIPREGSQISILVGSSQYDIAYESDELVVSGPEAGRVLAQIQKTGEENSDEPVVYQLLVNVPDGALNGSSIELVDGGDLTEFGLASSQSNSSTQSLTKLQGRSFNALEVLDDNETKSFSVSYGGSVLQFTISRDDQLLTAENEIPLSILPVGASVIPKITKDGDEYSITLSMEYYDGAVSQGPLRILPSITADEFGFGATDFSVELTDNGLRTVSVNGDPSNLSIKVDNLPGQVLSMEGLPDEDFIVLLESNGAKRLSSNFELKSEEDTKVEKDYRVKVLDASTGRVELFDRKTNTSIATRFTNGVVEFEADDYRFELAGFGASNDYFDIALNRSNAGDARNMIEMVALGQTTVNRSSFQDDFRQIALAVGAQLDSGRLLNTSAIAIRDAAIATEDELSGVNLDEEAGKLMEQQQAYKAAAQILQAARDLFDTIIGIM
jgi:flagellar hook-associated protein 1 FlgK